VSRCVYFMKLARGILNIFCCNWTYGKLIMSIIVDLPATSVTHHLLQKDCVLHGESKKTHSTFNHNFGKCRPIKFRYSLRIRGQLPVPTVNGKGDSFKNAQISNSEGLVTLTLDRVTLHTIEHHSSTSTYVPNFIGIEETFCARTDV